jgi:4-methylaminobutanoate oxidase (formaldehyde-forming)
VTEDFVLSGSYELDVARERIPCKVSLSPLYDSDMARVKA